MNGKRTTVVSETKQRRDIVVLVEFVGMYFLIASPRYFSAPVSGTNLA